MASLCKRQQCTIERRGFRQELDSWRHKLIHCVGKLFWYCVCVRIWRGPGDGACHMKLSVSVFSAARLKRPRENLQELSFLFRSADASHRTEPKNISVPSLCVRRGNVSKRLPCGFGASDLRGSGLFSPNRNQIRCAFQSLFYGCLFIVSKSCHVCRWSAASANERHVHRLARARDARRRAEFLVVCACWGRDVRALNLQT